LNAVPEWNSLEDIPAETLEAVLLYHVLGSTVQAQDIVGAGEGYVPTLSTNGPDDTALSLYFNFVDNAVELNGGFDAAKGADVTNADTNVGNGVIHVINKVLLLPTIADFALANLELQSLVAAILRADEGTNSINWLNAVSDPENTLTVFAPVNAAFVELLSDLGLPLDQVPPEAVNDILELHVVSGANVQSSGLGDLNGVIPTIGGNLDLDGTVITDGDGNTINILAPELVDIQSVNGVVHVVDFVIRSAVE
jgi:uncharacterized surface protein with fasciclin (FAS1) repeats